MIELESPQFLWLLLIIPAWIVWYWFRGKKTSFALTYGSVEGYKHHRWTLWVIASYLLIPMKLIGVALIIIALARPQEVFTERIINSEGVDIILAIDISGSMQADDLRPNRLAAAKVVARDFVAGRVADRIGLVVFAGQAYTQCPLTLDYEMLKEMIMSTTFDEANPGTAIGMSLAASINRLRDSEAKSKVVILLTDGRNNQGEIDPLTAADLAVGMGIKVYTIGVGRMGVANLPVRDQNGNIRYVQQEVDVDDATLTQVADLTGGKYYRATNNQSLAEIYAEIGALEKTKIDIKNYYEYEERYWSFLIPGFFLILLEFLLARTRLRPAFTELGGQVR